MTKAQARRIMHAVVARLTDSYLAAGQPYEDHGCDPACADCQRMDEALQEMRDSHDRRGPLPQDQAAITRWDEEGRRRAVR